MATIPNILGKQESGKDFARRLLRWSSSNLRDFPWRGKANLTPYRILVAELLLKRTTATAAARVYIHFLKKYPSLELLSEASETSLATDLVSVGLHKQRASAIKKLTRYLGDAESGVIPGTLSDLKAVPGLGDYSARAVLSFGLGVPAAIVDSNVSRVLGRVFMRLLPKRPNLGSIQHIADGILPVQAHREYNFGLLDLGALVCRSVKPKCEECPARDICDFYADGGQKTDKGRPSVVKELRLARGISLVGLAKTAGISKGTILNMESGRTTPRVVTLRRVAAALGVDVSRVTTE